MDGFGQDQGNHLGQSTPFRRLEHLAEPAVSRAHHEKRALHTVLGTVSTVPESEKNSNMWVFFSLY